MCWYTAATFDKGIVPTSYVEMIPVEPKQDSFSATCGKNSTLITH